MNNLEKLAKLIRYYILTSTTKAGSGHPTSSLSGVELMTALLFGSPAEASAKAGGFFRFDASNPQNPANDRLIFSKGHASPLFYSIWVAAGAITEEELMTLRKFGSRLEGHPTLEFPFTEAPTGSLGQGLSVGVGMALAAKLDEKTDETNRTHKTYVLLGDSEMAEGSQWEAMQIAAHYRLDNLIGILDVNRLGQRGETMYGYDLESYAEKIRAFGWNVIVVEDGHDLEGVKRGYEGALKGGNRPIMIIAKTTKGKGVSFIENKEGWHGKALSQEELAGALHELGDIDKSARGEIQGPQSSESLAKEEKAQILPPLHLPLRKGEKEWGYDKPTATRKAYGNALVRIGANPRIVALDAEVSNSTYAEFFKAKYPDRFFEMYVAEQNMVGAALGLSRRGKIPFVSTFAAFFTRAFDQIRMSQYADANIKFCGSHAGVSIGEDGASQMGLEDIAMFRTLLNGIVLYPSDAISTEKLVEEAARLKGIVYIRTTRKDTAILYDANEEFKIGGSKTLKSSPNDIATVIGAGITLHEALAAHDELKKENIDIRVIDLYSIKPLDAETLRKAAQETKNIITVEDHFAEGGIGEAVSSALNSPFPSLIKEGSRGEFYIYNLAVRKMPRSGKPDELLDYEEISRNAIIKKIKEIKNGS